MSERTEKKNNMTRDVCFKIINDLYNQFKSISISEGLNSALMRVTK